MAWGNVSPLLCIINASYRTSNGDNFSVMFFRLFEGGVGGTFGQKEAFTEAQRR